jgi:hypothetical protein
MTVWKYCHLVLTRHWNTRSTCVPGALFCFKGKVTNLYIYIYIYKTQLIEMIGLIYLIQPHLPVQPLCYDLLVSHKRERRAMCAYLNMCISQCVHITMCAYHNVCMSQSVHITRCAYLNVCISQYVHISMCAYLNRCISQCVHVSICAYLNVCIYQ